MDTRHLHIERPRISGNISPSPQRSVVHYQS